MKRTTSIITAAMILIVLANITFAEPPKTCPANGKLKIFILSGQSNMVGLKPEVSFTPAVKKAFAGDDVIVDAVGNPEESWWNGSQSVG